MGRRVLILGIGNVLWTDEGFGVRCVEAMAESHALPLEVRLLDSGTYGLYLLPFLAEADALLVFVAKAPAEPAPSRRALLTGGLGG